MTVDSPLYRETRGEARDTWGNVISAVLFGEPEFLCSVASGVGPQLLEMALAALMSVAFYQLSTWP